MKIIRILLLIANGGWLLLLAAAFVLAGTEWWAALVPVALLGLIIAGNFAYIWRFPPPKID